MTTPFEHINRAASAFQESCIITAAGELDLFTAILERGNSLTAQELASDLEADLHGTTVLLDTLTAFDYLLKVGNDENAVYSVAEPFQKLLDSRTSETYVPMLRHMAYVQRHWTQLAMTVKDGKPSQGLPSFLGEEQDDVAFIWAMNSMARMLVSTTVAAMQEAGINVFGRRGIRFIDIGGASGTYTQAFLDILPESNGTLFDLPVGADAARKRFVGSPYETRVTIIDGDFYQDEFPNGFDFAWISAIIHQHSLSETKKLFGKTFRALDSGGTIAVRDFVMDEKRIFPKDGTLFGINMLVSTDVGMVYTFGEIKQALESVGFADVRLSIPSETMSAIVTAKKP